MTHLIKEISRSELDLHIFKLRSETCIRDFSIYVTYNIHAVICITLLANVSITYGTWSM